MNWTSFAAGWGTGFVSVTVASVLAAKYVMSHPQKMMQFFFRHAAKAGKKGKQIAA